MEEEKNNFNLGLGVWSAVIFGAIVIGLAVLFRHDDSEEVYKSDLSKRYGVSPELLMQWGKKFCPWKVQLFYVGSKIKKVKVGYFDKYLGDPEERPVNLKGEKI